MNCFLLVTILFIILSSAVAQKDTELYNCTLGYVNINLEMNEDFKKVIPDDLDYDGQQCEQVLESFLEKQYESLKVLYTTDNYNESAVNCITEKIRKFDVGDLYILMHVYEQDVEMTELRRKKATWEVPPYIEHKLTMAEELCLPEKIFSEWFDSLYASTESDEPISETIEDDDAIEDLEEAYCRKNKLVAENFEGIASYNITTNSKNIDVKNIECASYWLQQEFIQLSGLKTQFQHGLKSYTSKQGACYHKTIKSERYAEMIFKVWALGEKKINEEDKIKERKLFVNFMVGLYEKLLAC